GRRPRARGRGQRRGGSPQDRLRIPRGTDQAEAREAADQAEAPAQSAAPALRAAWRGRRQAAARPRLGTEGAAGEGVAVVGRPSWGRPSLVTSRKRAATRAAPTIHARRPFA